MSEIPVACLCDTYDLKGFFGQGFAEAAPGFALKTPDEIDDPRAVRHALAYWPSAETLSRFPNLKLICTPGAGVDGIMRHGGLSPELTVVRTINPEQNRMMAGFAAYHVVGWHREMWQYPAQQAAEDWTFRDRTGPSTFQVGLLGFGQMGQAIAKGLHVLGYPVTAWATRGRESDVARVVTGPDGLEEVLGASRAVINVLPLTPATEGILDARTLGQMRPDAMLLQIARGQHLDQEALIDALDAGRPGLAALDVTDPEPLPKGHPLWRHPRVRITPHVASLGSPDFIARSVARAIRDWEAGRGIDGAVDLRRGY